MQITNRVKIIWGALLVLLLGAGGWCLYAVAKVPTPVVKAQITKKPSAVPAIKEKPKVKENTAINAVVPPLPNVASAGSLGRLSDLRSAKEELKLQVEIRELRDKLTQVPTPVIQHSAPLPPLEVPRMKQPQASIPAFPATPLSTSRGPVVVAVEGLDGMLAAVIRTGTNSVTVRKGSRFGGGIITDISRNAVMVTRGGKTAALPFE